MHATQVDYLFECLKLKSRQSNNTATHNMEHPTCSVKREAISIKKDYVHGAREGKVNLSFWIDEDLRNQLTIIWVKMGIRRTQDGMAEMVRSYLEAHGEG